MRAVQWLIEHRRRLAPAVALAGITVVGLEVYGATRAETDLRFALGATHDDVRGLELAFEREGEAHHGARVSFPAGAPEIVQHEVELDRGRWTVQVTVLRRGAAALRAERAFDVPADGPVRIDAF